MQSSYQSVLDQIASLFHASVCVVSFIVCAQLAHTMLYRVQLLVAAADGRSDEIHELLKGGANINIEYQNQVPDTYAPGMRVSDIVLW